MNKYLKIEQCSDALNAVSQLSQASDYLLGNLLSVLEEFPEKSLMQDERSLLHQKRLDVLGVTVSKEYPKDHEGRATYSMCWHLDDVSWVTLAEALDTVNPEHSERTDLIEYFGEFHMSIVAKPQEEYVRCSFNYEGHEFMCLMSWDRAVRMGYIEPKEDPDQISIEEVTSV